VITLNTFLFNIYNKTIYGVIMTTTRRSLKVQELNPSQLKKTESKMRKSSLQVNPMLGLKESLMQVSDHDLESLRRIGKDPEDISEAAWMVLERFRLLGGQLDREWKEVEPGIFVSGGKNRGGKQCPFNSLTEDMDGKIMEDPESTCPFVLGIGNIRFQIDNRWIGEEIVLSDFTLHIIEAHHFFNGQASEYRLDPLRAARVLSLVSEDTYQKESHRVRLYDPSMETEPISRGSRGGGAFPSVWDIA
jgi:hypothetical protein